MSTLATGWQAVSYGHATFSVYNFGSAGEENHELATSVIEESVSEPEPSSETRSAALPTLSGALPLFRRPIAIPTSTNVIHP